ncbi:TRAP transporter large permease [Pseudoteredinibacter isoporae]|uniref:TRAP transporter large permease protein n=1 Tax=Pseudoteredinibacter isoporae TaxID=570281 RepID=A0A7X0JQ83_9GAMM|nr:TRAP transporter large permease subunit [Pseudoteredinibacter isoporae]MBB6520284.1 tripartite ATP-independent transporter DctM subunit [Pseudoteredinibacter isoporae]NHO85855.1 TRAP transporter large permease subunit [Pseudoteredinibacter isoporae]NIB25693.1 TRAP transporter large permease subunit [Pseudoteredinibacter isoporae]
MLELIPLFMFAVVCLALMAGYPVAFTLAGVALIFAAGGIVFGHFDANLLLTMPDRLFGTMSNITLIAVPLFVLMGVMLEKSRLAEELLENMAKLSGSLPGGLGIAVVIVGMLLAASTGIVGATVVTMGLMSLPTMLKRGYSPSFATGTICATGTLGQIIPPSIALVLLGDTLSTAYQKAQLGAGVFNPKPVSVGDLFVGALVPGLILVIFYLLYVYFTAKMKPEVAPAYEEVEEIDRGKVLLSLAPPVLLIVLVLGSIISGIATPTEAAAVGALGATVLAFLKGQLNKTRLAEVCHSTTLVTAMVFTILIGASIFSLVFRGFGGEELIERWFSELGGNIALAVLIVMVLIFLLGFILDFIEITFVVVPIIGPVLLAMGVDPIWLGVMIAINLQTSFLTPPFGFALFYLRGVAPESVRTGEIYRGVIPFIVLQLALLLALALWPELATYLPEAIKADR